MTYANAWISRVQHFTTTTRTKLICSTLQYREQKVANHTTYANAWISPVQHIRNQQQQKYFRSKHKNKNDRGKQRKKHPVLIHQQNAQLEQQHQVRKESHIRTPQKKNNTKVHIIQRTNSTTSYA
jgi:hypothetical protein